MAGHGMTEGEPPDTTLITYSCCLLFKIASLVKHPAGKRGIVLGHPLTGGCGLKHFCSRPTRAQFR
jgi:hypothetical protein